MPQTATREKSLSEYADPDVVIIDKAKAFLSREQTQLLDIMKRIKGAMKSVNFDKIYAGGLPSEQNIIEFIRARQWTKVVPDKDHHIWERLTKMSDVQLSIVIDDSHYEVYEKWEKLRPISSTKIRS